MHTPDSIRDAVDRRARALGFTAETLSAAAGGIPAPDHLNAWLIGRSSMLTSKASRVLKALGLDFYELPREEKL